MQFSDFTDDERYASAPQDYHHAVAELPGTVAFLWRVFPLRVARLTFYAAEDSEESRLHSVLVYQSEYLVDMGLGERSTARRSRRRRPMSWLAPLGCGETGVFFNIPGPGSHTKETLETVLNRTFTLFGTAAGVLALAARAAVPGTALGVCAAQAAALAIAAPVPLSVITSAESDRICLTPLLQSLPDGDEVVGRHVYFIGDYPNERCVVLYRMAGSEALFEATALDLTAVARYEGTLPNTERRVILNPDTLEDATTNLIEWAREVSFADAEHAAEVASAVRRNFPAILARFEPAKWAADAIEDLMFEVDLDHGGLSKRGWARLVLFAWHCHRRGCPVNEEYALSAPRSFDHYVERQAMTVSPDEGLRNPNAQRAENAEFRRLRHAAATVAAAAAAKGSK